MYSIVYHQLVQKQDFKKISKGDQKKILRIIHKKLGIAPETFGKPLLGELKGYYRLRIDPYRIIFRVEREKIIVFVVLVGLRKDMIAYFEAAKRLGL